MLKNWNLLISKKKYDYMFEQNYGENWNLLISKKNMIIC